MRNTANAATIQHAGSLQMGDPYTLHFNLEISRESMLDLLTYLTGKQRTKCPVIPDAPEDTLSSNELESQIASIIQEIGIPAHIMGCLLYTSRCV